MKNTFTFMGLLFMGLSSVLGQTNSISGKITSNGEVLPFANLYLANTTLGTASNEEGIFKLKNIPNGNFTLVSSAIGFKSKSIKIVLTGNQNLIQNFNLSDENSLEEIVISGTLRPVSKSNSPVPVEVYSNTFFKKNPTPSIF